MRLTDLEESLYNTIDSYRKSVDHLVESINNRNDARNEAVRRGARNAAAGKKTMQLIILAAGCVVGVIYYKLIGLY